MSVISPVYVIVYSRKSIENYKRRNTRRSKNSLEGFAIAFLTTAADFFFPNIPTVFLSTKEVWGSSQLANEHLSYSCVIFSQIIVMTKCNHIAAP